MWIQVNGFRFEARGVEPGEGSASSGYAIVRLRGPVKPAQRERLAEQGAVVRERVSGEAYLCDFSGEDFRGLRRLPFVAWAGPYRPGLALSPALLPGCRWGERFDAAYARLQRRPEAVLPVDVVCHWDVPAREIVDEVARVADLSREELEVEDFKVRLRVSRARLAEVAAVPGVRCIEKARWPALCDSEATRILGAPPLPGENVPLAALAVPSAPGGGAELDGGGEIVAICDTGLDRGSLDEIHPAFAGRVLELHAFGRKKKTNDLHGHGTHCAALAIGAAGLADGCFRGAAPGARLILQSVNRRRSEPFQGVPRDLRKLLEPAYASGARIHSNSWNQRRSKNRYNETCSELDDAVWRLRDLVVLFAAGNAGVDRDGDGVSDPETVQAPGVAKNCITVGACKGERPEYPRRHRDHPGLRKSFPENPIHDDHPADSSEGMAPFSGRGPTQDGRIKPDLVAPGTCVLSARAASVESTDKWGESPDPEFWFTSGTSMSTALVAGCAAVVRQYLRRRAAAASAGDELVESPSAAIVKALLINGADDISGTHAPSEAPEIPNHAEGWGRVNLRAATASEGLRLYDETASGGGLETGENWQRELNSVDLGGEAGEVLKITLVWTDFPGRILQNDLDLVVEAGGEIRHGNQPPGSADFDRKNNVEQVLWEEVPPGPVRLTVRAHRVTHGPQSFALVVRSSRSSG